DCHGFSSSSFDRAFARYWPSASLLRQWHDAFEHAMFRVDRRQLRFGDSEIPVGHRKRPVADPAFQDGGVLSVESLAGDVVMAKHMRVQMSCLKSLPSQTSAESIKHRRHG